MLDLPRWQWALTAAMHITFPAVTVGTSIFLVVSYAMYIRTDDEVWLRMFRFCKRIFGIGFAVGVVSGSALTFEFGLNRGPFAHDVGPIVGVIIARWSKSPRCSSNCSPPTRGGTRAASARR